MYWVHGLQNKLAQHYYPKWLLNFAQVGVVLTTSISQGPTPLFSLLVPRSVIGSLSSYAYIKEKHENFSLKLKRVYLFKQLLT